MNDERGYILTINGGSSSVKFALFKIAGHLKRLFVGAIERIGQEGSKLICYDDKGVQADHIKFQAVDHASAAGFLIEWIERKVGFSSVRAVSHRIVHGMNHTIPELITTKLLDELKNIISYDPDHLPAEIELIEVLRCHHPKLIQIACFDTTFHNTMPRVARMLPIPRRFDTIGIQRYGFHGLSYTYLIGELGRIAGANVASGRVILAHLGNGCSLAAVLNGKSIDTSMGFTPAGGLMMGTRPGDLDPGAIWYMAQSEKLSNKQLNHLINHDCGLLGVSETSSDMRDLLAHENEDNRAAEAIKLFCYQVKKWIGSFAAVLGGLDVLVFAGGIGENCPIIRSRICDGLGFLGIELDGKQNTENNTHISTDRGKVAVLVIQTNEELVIAKTAAGMIAC